MPFWKTTGIIRLLVPLLVAWIGAPGPDAGPPGQRPEIAVDTVRVRLTSPLAAFTDAGRMDISPSGRLYVTDAGRDVVRVFRLTEAAHDGAPYDAVETDFVRKDTLAFEFEPGRAPAPVRVDPADPPAIGGSGTSPGLFADPSDVDASTALFITVADAGNGRIQRFTADGAIVEVLPVPRGSDEGRGVDPRFRSEEAAVDAVFTGSRPVVVETTGSDDVLVVEDDSGVVLMTDRRRSLWTEPGGPGSRPARPVDVESSDSRLLVADAADGTVYVYDSLGSLLHRISPSVVRGGGEARSLAICGTRVFLLASRWLIPMEFASERPAPRIGGRTVEFIPPAGESLRDVQFAGRLVYVLTNRALFVVPVDVLGRTCTAG